jgi:tetratricopeptide (TPR) repeat protein
MTHASENATDRAVETAYANVPIYVCAVLTSLAFAAFVVGYARYAEPVIARMDRSLGIVQFEKGQRFQEAGEYANAIQCYQLALEGKFEDPKYRTFTLKALGALLWWREDPQAALPYLEEAYAQPEVPITLYAPLCDSWLQVGRLDEIPSACERWRADAIAQRDAGQHAQAMYYLGRVTRELGDESGAREYFVQGVQLRPGGFNAYELGVSHYRSGEYEQALAYLDEFLEGGSGGRADYARRLRAEILKKLGRRQ